MAEQSRILILGGYGVFGRLLAAEILQRTGDDVIIAGRQKNRAICLCEELGAGRAKPLQLDADDVDSASRSFRDCRAVICAAGPFQDRDPRLPLLAARQGVHWFDISDSRKWIIQLLAAEDLRREAGEHGVTILPGLSTVPALSGAIIRVLLRESRNAVLARTTLYIANRNPKGAGAIASALQSGFSDPVFIDLPAGRKRAYRFESPDETLIPQQLGLRAEFRVAFEWNFANLLIARTQRIKPELKRRLTGVLEVLSRPFSRWGSDLSCLKVELLDERDQVCANCNLTASGQKLAVLPCLFAVDSLLGGNLEPGVINPVGWLAPDIWLDKLRAGGVEMVFEHELHE
ncbi:MAG TPA: saccharopine dehydrogenase NADP-binding domain-containing protein [Acidobacteriota bacterium]